MQLRFGALGFVGLLMMAALAFGQSHPLREAEGAGGAALRPDQPVDPRIPTLVPRAPQRPATPPAPTAPFTLTPEEQSQVDGVLRQWEERNRTIKTFDCRFKRWIYDLVFSPPAPNKPPEPKFVELGAIRYAAPDRGLFRLDLSEVDGKKTPIEDARAEHWISDGKSIFEYNPSKKQLIQHKLPAELQGKAIADSPLPFLFGAEAKKLNERYFIRLITPPDVKQQTWLEAFPRYQQDAANFQRAEFIISTQGMSPYALKLVQPNGKDYTVYQFYEIVVDDPLRLFSPDPFRPFTPLGWQKIVEEAPASAQASRKASDQRR
jgi:TIGR03009 family protein